jgi:hypothetical protein
MKPSVKHISAIASPAVKEAPARNSKAIAWQASVTALFALLLMQSFFNFAVGLLLAMVLLSGLLAVGLIYERRAKLRLPGKRLLLSGFLVSAAMLTGLTWVNLANAAPDPQLIFGFNAGYTLVMTLLGTISARAFNKLDRIWPK